MFKAIADALLRLMPKAYTQIGITPVPASAHLRISQRGVNLIKEFEGCRLTAYLCPARVWTIGYGSTGRHVTPGLTITKERAEELLREDLVRFEDAVRKAAGRCTQGQFDAMVSLAFNIGISAFRNSTLLKKHKVGDHYGASLQFARWNKAAGRVLPGLSRRRAAEAAMYRA